MGSLVVLAVASIGTSTQAPAIIVIRTMLPQQQTDSDISFELHELVPPMIAELRRLTGFTWEQLAHLFNVSRQTVHFWASGSKPSAENTAHLKRMLNTIRVIDRGSITENRAAFLATTNNGATLLDQLAAGNYDVVVSALGYGRQRVVKAATALSLSSKAARLPRPPEELVDAFQDCVHEDAGPARVGRAVRTKVRTPSGDSLVTPAERE